MEIADKIDPAEVLSHLNQMGYHNITPLQLKEFVRDLKKLIIYDRLSSSSSSLSSISSSITCSEYYPSPESPSDSSKGCTHTLDQSKPSSSRKCELKHRNDSRDGQCHAKSSPTSSQLGGVMKRSSTSSSALSQRIPFKENFPLQKVRTKSISEENLQEVMKPKTSFIRPWHLQGMQTSSVRSGSSDPVSLYHYYQTLWSKRKCPGEDSRADLRWVIRERMLGQDPHLYSRNIAGKNKSQLRM